MVQLCADAAMGPEGAILPLTIWCLSRPICLLRLAALHWAARKTQAIPRDMHGQKLIKFGK